jgi:hypothetical protein
MFFVIKPSFEVVKEGRILKEIKQVNPNWFFLLNLGLMPGSGRITTLASAVNTS